MSGSGAYPDIAEKTFQEKSIYIYQRFLPFRRADLNASASLQDICSGQPQLHTLCLASTSTSTRE
jgi:hypothetical protein